MPAHTDVITNVSIGYDLFLVRADVWHPRPVGVLGRAGLSTHKCMAGNSNYLNGPRRKGPHKPMSAEEAVNMLDLLSWTERKGLCAARRSASTALRNIAAKSHCRCFEALKELEASPCRYG